MDINKILVVDDSTVDRMNIENIVSAAGYTVISAVSGEEAVEKTKAELPDLVFMDVIMQHMDGYHACRQITHDEVTAHIPVVFVTSKGQKADRMWAEMQGAKGLVEKPYSSDDIKAEIERIKKEL